MPREKKTTEQKPIPMDKRIRRVLDDSWIAPVYFNAAITELLNKFNAMSDEELTQYMSRLVAPETAREHVKEIYNRLNNIQE
ncbi:hypothetical protein BN938_2288 [Mucinivorans hirudinis]|uniref:Uncharacterized protein n=1 Tax=Mucinivorans hirudinis TaxID=1433126 RepID=A0A060R9T2_9BACT|nr:hypothetical protein BN938_2288 [Mucinivorans hirudinis]